jgi:hypothetical protein
LRKSRAYHANLPPRKRIKNSASVPPVSGPAPLKLDDPPEALLDVGAGRTGRVPE